MTRDGGTNGFLPFPRYYNEKASKNETDWVPKIMCIITGEGVLLVRPQMLLVYDLQATVRLVYPFRRHDCLPYLLYGTFLRNCYYETLSLPGFLQPSVFSLKRCMHQFTHALITHCISSNIGIYATGSENQKNDARVVPYSFKFSQVFNFQPFAKLFQWRFFDT